MVCGLDHSSSQPFIYVINLFYVDSKPAISSKRILTKHPFFIISEEVYIYVHVFIIITLYAQCQQYNIYS